MARTSRNGVPSSSVDALDNLNLDDMFADDGDALFDGLDIDLGNMDDIAADGERKSAAGPPSSSAAAPEPKADDNSAAGRRKTKRKIKTPQFYEDEDEDFVDDSSKKRKKRPSKAVPPSAKKRTSKTAAAMAAAAAAPPAEMPVMQPLSKGKAKGKAAAMAMPPPVVRATSSATGVAAAGQFGGRQNKRSQSMIIPKTKSKVGRPPSEPGKAQRSQSLTMPNTMAQIIQTHPGLQQSPYCGMLPSNTLFYPFMPALPAEPQLKSRKMIPLMDRAHTTFMSNVNTQASGVAGDLGVKETDPIFKLLEEAFKDEKQSGEEVSNSDRSKVIGHAIGNLRKTISAFPKNRLAADLLAVCALLKRQFDFLKQNASNMEQWCKSHFSEAEYASVYLPPKPKKKAADATAPTGLPPGRPSLLLTFKNPEIKVNIICNGIKDAKSAALIAILPALSAAAKAAKPSKKRKLPPSAASSVASAKPAAEVVPKVIVTYPDMKPNKRRKCVAELITKCARDLESRYLQRFDDQLQVIDRQQSEMRKLVEDDKIQVPHTTGMWKWVEKSGYFNEITESDIRWRLDGIISPDIGDASQSSPSSVLKDSESTTRIQSNTALVDRLQSLLVDQRATNECDDMEDDESDIDSEDLYDEVVDPKILDQSSLTEDERVMIHLQSSGLVESLRMPPKPKPVTPSPSTCEATVQAPAVADTIPSTVEKPVEQAEKNPVGEQTTSMAKSEVENETDSDELGDVIKEMVADLGRLNNINNKRTMFLESIARSHCQNEQTLKKKNEEASLIAKCQQVLKKAREAKGKNGKAKTTKADEYALPW